MAERFVKKCIPDAARMGVDANALFGRAWDAFVMSLRKFDLISNSEQVRRVSYFAKIIPLLTL